MKLLYYNSGGTDGNDLSKVIAVYQLGQARIGIPANTPEEDIELEVIRAAGIEDNPAEIRTALLSESDMEVLQLFIDEVLPYLLQRGFNISDRLAELVVHRQNIKDRYPNEEEVSNGMGSSK